MRKAVIIRLSLLFLILAGLGFWIRQLISASSVEQLSEQANILEAIYIRGNYLEAVIWIIFAVGFAVAGFSQPGLIRRQRVLAAVTFLLFGLSDIVEVQTGAWWHPWWLFLWKSSCVISMVVLLGIYWQSRTTQK
ncbi:MAG: hypothetical protein WA919_06845 [Coleofasciculaceae cyanobacterium]